MNGRAWTKILDFDTLRTQSAGLLAQVPHSINKACITMVL